MKWNYRVIYHGKPGDVWFGIYEVYYEDDGTVACWTTEPVGIVGDDMDELRRSYDLIAEAFKMPVLDESELPGGKGE